MGPLQKYFHLEQQLTAQEFREPGGDHKINAANFKEWKRLLLAFLIDKPTAQTAADGSPSCSGGCLNEEGNKNYKLIDGIRFQL